MPKDSLEVYQKTIERMEPDISMVDRDAALASIAISLKRIADALEADNHTRLIETLSNIEMNLRPGR